MSDEQTIKMQLHNARTEVAAFLPKQALSDVQARDVLQRYTAAIEGNFVAWMGAAVITARSVQGRYAASENLWVEMKNDHAGMLRKFVAACASHSVRIRHRDAGCVW